MRADRLIAMLMLLQARGRLTAQQLAAELEVSVRTIYRDVEALSIAGVPIYAEGGPGGGIALLDDYRTTLTGLTETEQQAMLMLNIPSPLAELGLHDDLQSALLKLSAALPASGRDAPARVRQRIYLDPQEWDQEAVATPHLTTLHEALWADRWLDVTFARPFETTVARRIAPYGLVAKANRWWLVYESRGVLRVTRTVDVIDAALCDETFARPPDFDLVSFWAHWCERHQTNRPIFRAEVRLAPGIVRRMRGFIAGAGRAQSPDGWITVTLHFEDFDEARMQLLACGRAAEVLEPPALRLSLIDFAQQVTALYGGAS